MKKPNILHIGICSYQRYEGPSAAFIEAANEYREERPENVTEDLLDLGWHPDIIFLQVQSGNYPTALKTVLRHYANMGVKIIHFSGDIRHTTPDYMFDLAEVVTISCFSNDRDVANMRAKGYRSEFLQIGIDPLNFTPDGPANQLADIVFMGNSALHFPNGQLRMYMVTELKRTYGNRFKVFGNGWPNGDGECNVKNPIAEVNQWHQAEAAIYRGCKVAISMSSFNEGRYTSDRLFRAMGSGAFTLVHEFPGWGDVLLKKGQTKSDNFNVFKDIDDLKKQLEVCLQLGVTGNHAKFIHDNYTFKHMTEKILSL